MLIVSFEFELCNFFLSLRVLFKYHCDLVYIIVEYLFNATICFNKCAQGSRPVQRPANRAARPVASASSAVRRAPLVDEGLLALLPDYYRTLHDVLMAQPAGYASYTFPYPDGLFGKEGEIALQTTDIIDVYNGAQLNASILQIYCMYVVSILKNDFLSSSHICLTILYN